MDEDLPILLKFEVEEKTIKFRLDQFGLNSFDLNAQPINEIILRNYETDKILLENLREYVGEVFEYEIYTEAGKTLFQFWADYSGVEGEIICQPCERSFHKYTNEDLAYKGKIISKLFIDISEKYQKNYSQSYSLREKLKSEITNEIEKAHRKVQFFENKTKGKSEAFYSQEIVLQKLLKILNETPTT
ncbi:MAG TPA: hypothetical protein VEX64_00610 [Pyrinomonadaceae bacterium]|nr:hypothetical protein [Pyrinomonadaceae bacterium]